MTLSDLRRQLLEARDARAELVVRLGSFRDMTPVFLSLNIPGADKNLPGLEPVVARARAALLHALPDCRVEAEGRDALGPWAALVCRDAPAPVKLRCIDLEVSLPAGRLIDLDVYDRDGRQVDRRSLGRPPRGCLVCGEPAVDCIRLQRHTSAEINASVHRLLE